jgi:electron transport complex protein RnfC
LVKDGDRVVIGEKIAESKKPPFLAFHASISGKVSFAGAHGRAPLLEIQSDGKDEMFPGIGKERSAWELLNPEDLHQILKDSGIEAPYQKTFKTIILNGCESEPYVTSNHSLAMSHPLEILKAGEIFFRAFGAKELLFVFEDNKGEIVELFKSKVFFNEWSHAEVEIFPTRYPQENETLLLRDLGKDPSKTWVTDLSNAFAAYEAVVMQKPFYERVVTLAGECVAQPRNFWIRTGTLVEDAVKYARGFLREPERVVLGGPMKGRATSTLAVPILKDTSAILGLPKEVVLPDEIEPCIRCGRCTENCPVSISPVMITVAAEKNLFELAREYGAGVCIDCGNCSYVCPAKRPMTELIQYARAGLAF